MGGEKGSDLKSKRKNAKFQRAAKLGKEANSLRETDQPTAIFLMIQL